MKRMSWREFRMLERRIRYGGRKGRRAVKRIARAWLAFALG